MSNLICKWTLFVASGAAAMAQVPSPQPDGPFHFGGLGPMMLAQSRGRAAEEDHFYERGQRALDQRKWEDAVELFNELGARGGQRADAALYWKVYALNKLGRRDEALAALSQFQKTFPNSRWGNDAKALDVEIRQAAGRPVTPDEETDEDLKLMAINGLLHSDAERAIPMLEKLLQSSTSLKLKERALFVLAQSRAPKALEVLSRIAKGGLNPDLQYRAVRYMSQMRAKESREILAEVYAATSDAAIKREILRSYHASGDRDRLLQAARSEKLPDLRIEAIRQLGGLRAHAELWQIYQSETDAEIKENILRSFSSADQADKLIEVARTEKDPKLRRAVIRSLGSISAIRTGDVLVSLYGTESDPAMKKEVMRALESQNNVKALVDIARKETDVQMKKEAVSRLSHMKSKEATDFLMEILNK